MHLYFFRHGQSYANLTKPGERKPADFDTGLTAIGQKQAQSLVEWVGANLPAPDVFIASTLQRTRETAEYIQKATGGEVQFEDSWREITYCYPDHRPIPAQLLPIEWDQFSWSEYAHRPLAFDAQGAPVESVAAFRMRLGTALENIIQDQNGKVVYVISHGGVLNGLLDILFNVGVYRRLNIHPGYTSISRFEYMGSQAYVPWEAKYIAMAAHLPDGGLSD
jgi:probable phosphoglycerate mutase